MIVSVVGVRGFCTRTRSLSAFEVESFALHAQTLSFNCGRVRRCCGRLLDGFGLPLEKRLLSRGRNVIIVIVAGSS
jgi:hypothetical protein